MPRRLSPAQVRVFRKKILVFYRTHGRDLPWRRTKDPYHILVSEIMLQQTQVDRVVQKYAGFLKRFPDLPSLAGAPLADVISAWQGLGYNRRALTLKKTAERLVKEFRGKIPASRETLMTLPGIGPATASAIAAFAFDRPVSFIETNIRRTFIRFFFRGKADVDDKAILPLVEQTLDRPSPRRWYSALMDYGSMLGRKGENPNRRSAHYQRQSPYEGSNRQIRGLILRLLVSKKGLSRGDILRALKGDAGIVEKNILRMSREGLIRRKRGRMYLG